MPSTATTWGNAVFRNCTALKSVNIPVGVKTLGGATFQGCSSLEKVLLPEGVTSIGASCFSGCTALEKVYVPASVNTINSKAFYDIAGAIYCVKDSFAHEYAVANNIKYVLVNIVETENTDIDYDNLIIRTSVEVCDDITELLGLSEAVTIEVKPSYEYGNLELLGTGTIVTVFDGDYYIGDFTLVVEGDINGDSVCDALDAMHVGLASNGHRTLDGAYALAADSNADEIVDANDYQVIVNRAVS